MDAFQNYQVCRMEFLHFENAYFVYLVVIIIYRSNIIAHLPPNLSSQSILFQRCENPIIIKKQKSAHIAGVLDLWLLRVLRNWLLSQLFGRPHSWANTRYLILNLYFGFMYYIREDTFFKIKNLPTPFLYILQTLWQ